MNRKWLLKRRSSNTDVWSCSACSRVFITEGRTGMSKSCCHCNQPPSETQACVTGGRCKVIALLRPPAWPRPPARPLGLPVPSASARTSVREAAAPCAGWFFGEDLGKYVVREKPRTAAWIFTPPPTTTTTAILSQRVRPSAVQCSAVSV